MRTRSAWILSLVLGVASVATPAGGPPRLVHTPPGHATAGEDLPVAVTIEGFPAMGVRVVLSYRTQGNPDFVTQRLVAAPGGRFAGAVPGSAVRGLKLDYTLEVTGPERSGFALALGSREAPIQVAVRDPEPVAGLSLPVKILVVVLPIGLATVGVWLRDRRRRHRVLDQIFWVRTLLPLTYLQGEALSSRVTDLTRVTLDHPVAGSRCFPRDLILQKLHAVRRMDLGVLLKERDRYLGLGFELASTPPPTRKPGPRRVAQAGVAVGGN